MRLNQLVLLISKYPEEYTDAKHIEMPEGGGSIGRAVGCTLALKDHNRFISSTHCLVSTYGDTYYISDVSTNGTMVNGHKILKNQPVSICDGDIIALGQYEIGVCIEPISKGQDIAVDIAPERVSNDPLLTLGDVMVHGEQHSGDVDGLFLETRQDKLDCHDPIEHLTFSTQREDDHLIRDEGATERTSSRATEHARQIADDSLSIHSEFEMPNLIPEDWMVDSPTSKAALMSSNVLDETEIIPEDFQKEPIVQHTDKTRHSSSHDPQIHPRSATQQSKSKHWEDVTHSTASPEYGEQSEQPAPLEQVGRLTKTSDEENGPVSVHEISQAFYEGLGITNPDLIKNETLLFKQMGTCLRLCMEKLQKELYEVETLKEEKDLNQSESNLAELMLTLNSQNLLAPNELVEQMLDEINDHQVAFNAALNELLLEQSEASDPVTFADKLSRNSMFTTKSKLWDEYLAFYEKNRNQLNETSLKGLIRKNYNKAMRGSHA